MRFLLAFVILLSLSPAPLMAEAQDGQTDLSSNWGREDGFPVGNEKLSRAAEFLSAVRPEDFRKSRKPQSQQGESDSEASGTH